jgi:hypothetical protein
MDNCIFKIINIKIVWKIFYLCKKLW